MSINEHSEDLTVYVTKLDHYDIALGMPWLRKHRARMEWDHYYLEINSNHCRDNCLTGTVTPKVPYQASKSAAPLKTGPSAQQKP